MKSHAAFLARKLTACGFLWKGIWWSFDTPSDAREPKKYIAVCGSETRMRLLRILSNTVGSGQRNIEQQPDKDFERWLSIVGDPCLAQC
ncbi:hypothetical protein B0H11DRAFT_1184898 [Mycena galericulata]|nr:hypothetical protein B0H11DRAFT_1184898 [Mycena galericulata]